MTRAPSALSPSAVRRQIEQGKIAPLYLLVGPEDFERREVLDLITRAVVEPATRAFNHDVLVAAELDVDDAIGRITAFPMMAPRRLVVIRRVEDLDEHRAGAFLPVIARPPESTVLVFTADKIDGRKKLFLEMRRAAVSVEFPFPKESEVPAWIDRRVRKLGKAIEKDAAHLLALSVGPRPSELANEIEKLDLHAGERQTLTADDVAWIVGASKEESVFAFTKAVLGRDAKTALSLAQKLAQHGQSEVGMVALLARDVGILLKTRWLLQARTPQSAMAGRLKVPPFTVKDYVRQAQAFTDAQLRGALAALLEADDWLKLRSRTADAVMARLVHRICSGGLDASAPPG